jgi:hypothetical protein
MFSAVLRKTADYKGANEIRKKGKGSNANFVYFL